MFAAGNKRERLKLPARGTLHPWYRLETTVTLSLGCAAEDEPLNAGVAVVMGQAGAKTVEPCDFTPSVWFVPLTRPFLRTS